MDDEPRYVGQGSKPVTPTRPPTLIAIARWTATARRYGTDRASRAKPNHRSPSVGPAA